MLMNSDRRLFHRAVVAMVVGVLGLTAGVHGQGVTCGAAGTDAVMDIFDVGNYNPVGAYDAIAVGGYCCNVGNAPMAYAGCPSNHPVFGSNLYRYSVVNGAGRFEQIGLSWLKHASVAAQSIRCCSCTAMSGGLMGPGCADLYTSGLNGAQGTLGPRYQVNAYTGEYPMCPPRPTGGNTGRLEVALSDLTTSVGGPNAPTRFFYEMQAIERADAMFTDAAHPVPVNGLNNASNIEASITGTAANYTFAIYPAGGSATNTQRGVPAIRRWKEIDPAVTETVVDVPGEGRFILSSKATSLGGSPEMWRYEYALFNLNSDRCAGSFTVPLPIGVASNTGFHAVLYRGGDGVGNVNVDGTPWVVSTPTGAISWWTQDYAANPNANAVRWSTLTNFRLDTTVPPAAGGGLVTIGLWKPGTPTTLSAAAQVPGCAGPVITTQPVSASVCATGAAPFAVNATGVAPVRYAWQIETAPDVWQTIGNDPLPLSCSGGGFASVSAIPPQSAATTIRIRPCAGVSRYQIRAVVSDGSGCANAASSEATYIICDADFNCSGPVGGIGTSSVTVQDVFDFLGAYFANDVRADVNASGGVSVEDIFDFLGVYFGGCV